MKSPNRPPIRNCPVCRIAMQASKSREGASDFDTFECLTCHTVIVESSKRPAPAPAGGDGAR